jgi:hypothetical protein
MNATAGLRRETVAWSRGAQGANIALGRAGLATRCEH